MNRLVLTEKEFRDKIKQIFKEEKSKIVEEFNKPTIPKKSMTTSGTDPIGDLMKSLLGSKIK
jgi:hypothetical protein